MTTKTTPDKRSTKASDDAEVEPAAEDEVTLPAGADEAKPPVVTLGKRELIERVVAASGLKKKAVKPVLEVMLKELGDALSREEALNLQPFGKISVKRNKQTPNAEVIELRLRRSKLAVENAAAAISDRDVDEPAALADAAD